MGVHKGSADVGCAVETVEVDFEIMFERLVGTRRFGVGAIECV